MRSGKGKYARVLRVLTVTLLLVLAFAATAQAALAKVKITKVKPGVSKVTVKWSKAAGAKGYYVYIVDDDDNAKKVATVNGGSKLSTTVKKLKNGTTYQFAVAAFAGTTVGEMSDTVEGRPQVGNPGKVREARILKNKNKKVWLKWAYNAKASGYQILMEQEDGEYKVVRTITSKTKVKAKVSNLKNGETYHFKIRAFVKKKGSIGYGPLSAKLTGKPVSNAVMKALSQVHPLYYKAKMTRTVTAGGVTLKKGKKVTVVSLNKKQTGYATSCRVSVGGGKTVKIPTSALKFTSLITNYKKAYSKAVAESFVNTKGYSSVTNYLVWISTYTQHLYVFKGSAYKWQLVMDTKCSTGVLDFTTMDKESGKPRYTETPIVNSQITAKKAQVPFNGDVTGGHWGCRLAGGYMHSWSYYASKVGDKIVVGNKRCGKEKYTKPRSHGCVRMPIAKAKYIYDNCPINTEVVAY